MGSSVNRRRWCSKTVTTCTIKGYHILIILTLSIFTAYLVFQPADISQILTVNRLYKAKLNESQTFASNIEHKLHSYEQHEYKFKNNEKRFQSSLEQKNQEVNGLKASNLKLQSYVKRLTHLKQKFENQTEMQRNEITHLHQISHDNPQTQSTQNTNDYWYIRNHKQWTQGIGDNFMFNNETDSNCLFPPNSFIFHKEPTPNSDTLYEGARYCNKYRFSHIFDRIITVHCEYIQRSDPLKAGIKYYEYEGVFNSRPPKNDDSKWVELSFENGKRSHFAIDLKDTTQTTWIYCNNAFDFHISLVSLQKLAPEKYGKKQEKVSNYFGDNKVPPNVILFMMAGTSRNNFMNSAVESVNYLNSLDANLNGKAKSDILQFFRYSTVGNGKENNLNALVGGKCDYCALSDDISCDGLGTFYDRLGYFVFGLDEYKQLHRAQKRNDDLCGFYLNDNVVPRGCKFGHWIQLETATEFIKQGLRVQTKSDKEVPYLMMFNVQTVNPKMMYNLDRFIRNMLEVVNKENTVINIISDHGLSVNNALYHWPNAYNNPINILLLPTWLRTENYINFENLQTNQQRMVNHYDMNLFYKELLFKLHDSTDLNYKIEKNRNEKYQSMIKLARINDVPLSKSILDGIIERNRDCHGTADGFCLCDAMKSREISLKLVEDHRELINSVLMAVNMGTGDGNLDCEQFRSTEFTITAFLENNDRTLLRMAISKTLNDANEQESLMKMQQLLTYTAVFIRENAGMEYKLENESTVEKIDNIRQECVTTNYNKQQFSDYNSFDFGDDSALKPMFRVRETAIKMIKYKGPKVMDLALCACKNIDFTDVTVVEPKIGKIAVDRRGRNEKSVKQKQESQGSVDEKQVSESGKGYSITKMEREPKKPDRKAGNEKQKSAEGRQMSIVRERENDKSGEKTENKIETKTVETEGKNSNDTISNAKSAGKEGNEQKMEPISRFQKGMNERSQTQNRQRRDRNNGK